MKEKKKFSKEFETLKNSEREMTKMKTAINQVNKHAVESIMIGKTKQEHEFEGFRTMARQYIDTYIDTYRDVAMHMYVYI